MPRIYCDHHHQALYHSLQMLFEDRLGWELYRPIGTDWYEQGFWKVYDHPATVNQFLGLHQGTEHPTDVHGQPLPEDACVNKHYVEEDGIYYITDTSHNSTHRAITLDKFSSLEFDVVLSSIPQHIPLFNRLIAERQPTAKHVFQVGNAWGHQPGVNNILASTAPFPVPPDINVCFYHQEFDLEIFRYRPVEELRRINSYVHYMKRPDLMQQVLLTLGWEGTSYGAGFPTSLPGVDPVSQAMINSSFTWHYKPEGDGYGHVLFSTYACGRPAIIDVNHYRGKLAEKLLVPGVTCINLSGQDLLGLVNTIRSTSLHQMSEAAYHRFKEVVDFNEDERQVRLFLENLI